MEQAEQRRQKSRSNSIKSDTAEVPIETIQKQLDKLKSIDKSQIEAENQTINISLKVIIYNFDIILNHKLKIGETHFWNIIHKYFRTESVKFINNVCDKLKTFEEKGLSWICIAILEGSFKSAVLEIYNQNFDLKFYQSESYLIKSKAKILDLLNELEIISEFNINLELFKEFEEYKQINQDQDELIDEDSPHFGHRKISNIEDQGLYTTPTDFFRLENHSKFL